MGSHRRRGVRGRPSNLIRRADDGLIGLLPEARRPWSVEPADAFAPSRLLLPGWITGIADVVGAPPVVAIPHREALWGVERPDADAIVRLARLARTEYQSAPGPLSPALYSTDAHGAVVPLVLPNDHPAAMEVNAGHALLARDEAAP